jgi:uncharacterized protein (TIGR00290 family)
MAAFAAMARSRLMIVTKPRAWVCWSSGKDSAWALHVARQQQEVDVVGLLTTVTDAYGRVSMHGVREEVLEAQADAVGLPLYRARIPASCPNETYEAVMKLAVATAIEQGVTEMIFGDLFLEDVRAYRERRLQGTGVRPRFPLWGRPTHQLAIEMIDAGVRAYITCLDPRKVPRELAGRLFNRDVLEQLADDADHCAERGEFHTCVVEGPMFRRPLDVEVGETVERDGFVFTDLRLSGRP